MQSDNASTPL